MAVITGKAGTLQTSGDVALTPVGEWTYNRTGSTPNWVDNTTSGENTRIAGPTDSTGTFIWKLDSGSTPPLAMHGTGTLELHIDGEDANYITVPMICTGWSLTCNFGDGNELGIQFEFAQTGAPSFSGALSSSGL